MGGALEKGILLQSGGGNAKLNKAFGQNPRLSSLEVSCALT